MCVGGGIPRSVGGVPRSSASTILSLRQLRPVRLLRVWVSKGLTQADSEF